jgi:purine-nucleoside phosphorylase
VSASSSEAVGAPSVSASSSEAVVASGVSTAASAGIVEALRERLGGFTPRVLLTLGSGLGGLADVMREPLVIPFDEVGLPQSTVPGHTGRLLAGELSGVPVLVQQGRIHLYEGVPVAQVVAVVEAAAAVGAEVFCVTNAAGGLAPQMEPGDLMLISDHLNLSGTTPLVGPRFLDMAGAYDPDFRAAARAVAESAGERLLEGVYAGLSGPAYETPAEVRMLRTLGADAVGMSTVLEVIAARAAGLRVVGFSLITNVHRPGGTPTAHEEVLEAGETAGPRLASLVAALLPRVAGPAGE